MPLCICMNVSCLFVADFSLRYLMMLRCRNYYVTIRYLNLTYTLQIHLNQISPNDRQPFKEPCLIHGASWHRRAIAIGEWRRQDAKQHGNAVQSWSSARKIDAQSVVRDAASDQVQYTKLHSPQDQAEALLRPLKIDTRHALCCLQSPCTFGMCGVNHPHSLVISFIPACWPCASKCDSRAITYP